MENVIKYIDDEIIHSVSISKYADNKIIVNMSERYAIAVQY